MAQGGNRKRSTTKRSRNRSCKRVCRSCGGLAVQRVRPSRQRGTAQQGGGSAASIAARADLHISRPATLGIPWLAGGASPDDVLRQIARTLPRNEPMLTSPGNITNPRKSKTPASYRASEGTATNAPVGQRSGAAAPTERRSNSLRSHVSCAAGWWILKSYVPTGLSAVLRHVCNCHDVCPDDNVTRPSFPPEPTRLCAPQSSGPRALV